LKSVNKITGFIIAVAMQSVAKHYYRSSDKVGCEILK